MTRRAWRVPLLATAILSLFWAVWLGLLRIGWALPLPFPDQLILHGPLMIGGFLGTLIGLERAIGLHERWAFAAPAASALGAVLLVAGIPAGALLIAFASVVVFAVFVVIVRRQPTLFGATMLLGAAAWCIANAWWCLGASIYRVVFWWIAFVVLTIAGERLELTRLLRHGRAASLSFITFVVLLCVAVAAQVRWPSAGLRVAGGSLALIAVWLLRYDIARRTVRQPGVTRFIAVCLLSGHAWLLAAGVFAATAAPATPGVEYDALLHAVFLGFVVSMIFGHAPIVVPAVLGRPLRFHPVFYAHVVALHVSLIVRIAGDLIEDLAGYRRWGGLLNALTLVLFLINNVRAMRDGRAGIEAAARQLP
jgi:hypothetical protein